MADMIEQFWAMWSMWKLHAVFIPDILHTDSSEFRHVKPPTEGPCEEGL